MHLRTGAGDRPHRLRPRLATLAALAAVAMLAVALSFGMVTTGSAPGPTDGQVNRESPSPAPPLSGQTLNGERFDLPALRGHVVLVNVFAAWCGPCRAEIPLLISALRRWSVQGLRIVGIDVRDSDTAVRALLDETQAQELSILPDPTGAIAVAWGARGVPETFLIDRDGRIVAWAQGPLTQRWIERWLAPLLDR